MISPRENMAEFIATYISHGFIEASYDGNILFLRRPHIGIEKDNILAIDMENKVARGATYQVSQHDTEWVKDHLKRKLTGDK